MSILLRAYGYLVGIPLAALWMLAATALDIRRRLHR